MLVTEFLHLSDWFNEQEEKYRFTQKLDSLNKILAVNVQSHANNRNNQPFQSFTEQKNQAIESLADVELNKLSISQISLLELYGAKAYLGIQASQNLRSTFESEGYDMAHLQSEVSSYLTGIKTAKNKLNTISKNLDEYKKSLTKVTKDDHSSRLSIIFQNDTSITNLKDLQDEAKNWKVIIHKLSKGLDVDNEDFKIVGARNGSIIIDLSVAALSMIPIGFILNRSFEIMERFALFVKRTQIIKNSSLEDPAFKKIEENILKEQEKYFNLEKIKSASQISEELLEKFKLVDNDNSKERKTFLESAIRKILDHIKRGGDIDLYVPEQIEFEEGQSAEENIKMLQDIIQDYREKKRSFKLEEVKEILREIAFTTDEDNEDID